ncbi:NUDIX hydrolase [Mucilaginibacter robiniae]|uniref:NUDIX hydrolase n=1 Tax=Mucilaginibacter robiniae TaxID=2728022 RepID=A0A7L5E187_9SPHI|nr:NUDIX hydrolase [Mucilaginibacter robiniae]QJD96059.1 NUDIX hydrolase [Mucilaginibacter robiniae]
MHPKEFYRNLPRKTVAACLLIPCEQRHLLLRKCITGQWTLPGGIVEQGEAPDAAALRECKEETGLFPAIERLMHTYFSEPVLLDEVPYGDSVHFIFLTKPVTSEQCSAIAFNDDEIDGYCLADADELVKSIQSNLGRALSRALNGETYSVWKRTHESLRAEADFYR